MADITYQQAITAQTAQQIRDLALLSALAVNGSTVGGAPTSSPDRGLVEAEARFLAMEQALRRGIALSISATSALAAGDDWVDAAASWYQVPSNQGPGGTPGGVGRFVATSALWSVQLGATAAALPLTLSPGQVVQIQATDSNHSIFNLSVVSPVTITTGANPSATFLARVAGTVAGNVTAAQIKAGAIIAGPAGLFIYQGADPTLVTTARDQETSAALLIRCYGRWGTLGAGWTRLAFDYLIPSFAPNTTRWYVRDDNPFGPGSVGIWMATPAAPSSSADVALVYNGLTAPGTKRLGSGPLLAQGATDVAMTITVVLGTDGSNPTLVADVTSALQTLAIVLMGPAIFRFDLLGEILRGAAIQTALLPETTASAKTITLNLPGFGGVVDVASLSTSPDLGQFGYAITSGQIFTFTIAASTVTV